MMRAIKLDDIVGATINDAAILNGVAIDIGLHPKTKARILASYKLYKRRKGTTALPVLNLKPPLSDKLSSLYTSRAAKHGLAWIEKIATTAKYGYCPMCGAETHKTVEHVLPRKPWAEFTIFSLNLVPSCGDCNGKRGNHANAPGTELRMLHPYFDGAILSKRLHITKITGPFDIPKFEPQSVSTLSAGVKKRVLNHLRKNIDLVVYHQYCTNRWSEMQMEAKRAGTIAALKGKFGTLLKDSKRISGPNSWKTAFYAGLISQPAIAEWLFLHRKTF